MELEGEDAKKFLEYNDRELTEEELKSLEEAVEIYLKAIKRGRF